MCFRSAYCMISGLFSMQEIAHELLGDRFSTGVLLIIISYKKVQEDMKLWKRDCLHQSL